MSWASDTKFRLQIFCIFLTFLCPTFLVWQAADLRRQVASRSWPSVEGEVQGINVKTWFDDRNDVKYYGRVGYTYSVGGEKYTSELTDLGPGAKRSNRETAFADVSQYRPGMKLPVYYDPADPSIGVIAKGVPTIHLVLAGGLAVGSIIGPITSIFTVRGWIRAAKQKPRKPVVGAQPVSSADDFQSAPAGAEVGDRIELFKPMIGNVVAGGIFTALLFGGGVTILTFIIREIYLAGGHLPVDAKKGMSWLAVGIGSLLGIGFVVGSVFLARYVRWLYSHSVELCENGYRYREGKHFDEVPWELITSIRETVVYERPPILKGPAKILLPKTSSRNYVVTVKSGKQYGFDCNSVRAIARFGELLHERAKSTGIPWETVEEHV